MGDIGEAHYIQDDKGTVLGVASDELCLEIDARIARAEREVAQMETEGGTVRGDASA